MAAKSDKTAMAKAAKKADALLREMVAVTLKSDLSRIQRTNLETCITVHMHQKETSGVLISLPDTCYIPVRRARRKEVIATWKCTRRRPAVC